MAETRAHLAGNRAAFIPLLSASLASLGYTDPVVSAGINVTELGREAPELLLLDVDFCASDPIELLRQMRFVLPTSTIAVYSGLPQQHWARSCHLAGANCVLSKQSDEAQLVAGLRQALETGCFTDPIFN